MENEGLGWKWERLRKIFLKRTVVHSIWIHSFLERFLGVSLAPDIVESNKWYIFKNGSLHHSIKYRTPPDLLQEPEETKNCCHVWAGDVQFTQLAIAIGAVVKRPFRQRKNWANDGIIRCTLENNRWFESNLLSSRNLYSGFSWSAMASIFTLLPSDDARTDFGY